MKAKARVRCFWRHNKKMTGMWGMLIQIIMILMPPYCTPEFIVLGGFACIWHVVWIHERRADSMRRVIGVISHKYIRELITHREDVNELLDELLKEREEHIKSEKERHVLLKEMEIDLSKEVEIDLSRL